jgi:tetratricopeptide (TPR) repeat protein
VVYFQYVNAAIKPDDGYIDKAAECARSVLALDPNSTAGHVLAGMVSQNRGRPADADRSYKTALTIDPTNIYALAEACRIYLCVGRVNQSRAVTAQWVNFDPLSPLSRAQRIFQEFLSGDDAVAQDVARRLLRHDPDFVVARLPFVLSLIRTGRRGEARDAIQAARAPATTLLGSLLHFLMLALDDKPDEAAAVTPELLERARTVEWWSWHVAECFAVIDDRERAIDWLENAFQRGFRNYPYLATHPTTLFRRLDDHPRLQELLGRMKTAWEQFDA